MAQPMQRAGRECDQINPSSDSALVSHPSSWSVRSAFCHKWTPESQINRLLREKKKTTLPGHRNREGTGVAGALDAPYLVSAATRRQLATVLERHLFACFMHCIATELKERRGTREVGLAPRPNRISVPAAPELSHFKRATRKPRVGMRPVSPLIVRLHLEIPW